MSGARRAAEIISGRKCRECDGIGRVYAGRRAFLCPKCKGSGADADKVVAEGRKNAQCPEEAP